MTEKFPPGSLCGGKITPEFSTVLKFLLREIFQEFSDSETLWLRVALKSLISVQKMLPRTFKNPARHGQVPLLFPHSVSVETSEIF